MPQRIGRCAEPWSSTTHRKKIILRGNNCGMSKQNYTWKIVLAKYWYDENNARKYTKHEEIKWKILSVIFLMNISFYSKTVKKSALYFILYIFLYNIRSQNYSLSNAYFSLSNVLFLIQWVVHSKNLFMRIVINFVNIHTTSAV